jgi:hypothetical protein
LICLDELDIFLGLLEWPGSKLWVSIEVLEEIFDGTEKLQIVEITLKKRTIGCPVPSKNQCNKINET